MHNDNKIRPEKENKETCQKQKNVAMNFILTNFT
jgi:hypothetical protein